MKKITDALIIFISSILALLISSYLSNYASKLYEFFEVTQNFQSNANGFGLALLITIITEISHKVKDVAWNKINIYFSPIQIDIHFIDNSNKKVQKVFFEIKEDGVTKQEVGLRVSVKKTGVVALYIAKKMNLVITLKYNPNYFSTELKEGFLASNSNGILNLDFDGEIVVNVLPVLVASLEPIRLDEFLIIQPKFLKTVKGQMLITISSLNKFGKLFNKLVSIQSNSIELSIKEVKRDN